METITINGNVYKAKELDFNFLCDLSDAGIGIEEIDTKILSATRVYIASCMGVKPEIAGNEINAHIIKGGDLKDVVEVFSEKANESDFFLALGKNSEPEKKATKKTSKKTSEEEVSE